MNRLLKSSPFCIDFALLLLRVFLGLTMMVGHGWGKMIKMFNGDFAFASVLGMSEKTSMILAVIAEVLCALLLAFGIFTRLALIPLIITMAVAVFIIHADDPFNKQEFGLLFMVPFITLFFTGPGKYSVDYLIFKK